MPLAPLLNVGMADAATDCLDIRNVKNSNAYDWSKICNLEQFWEMWNERRQALGLVALDVPAAGCDCQYMGLSDPASPTGDFSVATIQTWLEANCTSFVRSHDDNGDLYPAEYWDGDNSIDMWTLADLHTIKSTWLNNLGTFPNSDPSGFYRLDNTGTPQVGIADGAGGDYFYHPLWNELYAFMRLLRYTKLAGFLDRHSEDNERIASSAEHPTWGAAYLDAATKWGITANIASGGGAAWAICYGIFNVGTGFQCTLDRLYNYGDFSGIPNGIGHEMEVYQVTGLFRDNEAHGSFFNHDDDNFRLDVYSIVETHALATTATRAGAVKIGSLSDPPEQGPAPAEVGTNTAHYGWESRITGGPATDVQPVGVLKWDFVYT